MPRKGEVIKCAVCGALTVVQSNGRTMYCDKCREIVKRDQQRQANERSWQNHKAAGNHQKSSKPVPTVKPKYTLAEMNQAAREHGMTYGRYAAALAEGRVAPPKQPKKKKRS